MPATPQGNGGERCAKAEQGSRTSATETVPGELGGVLPMERAGETEGAAGVEKRTRFTAPTLDKESPVAQEGGEWSTNLAGWIRMWVTDRSSGTRRRSSEILRRKTKERTQAR